MSRVQILTFGRTFPSPLSQASFGKRHTTSVKTVYNQGLGAKDVRDSVSVCFDVCGKPHTSFTTAKHCDSHLGSDSTCFKGMAHSQSTPMWGMWCCMTQALSSPEETMIYWQQYQKSFDHFSTESPWANNWSDWGELGSKLITINSGETPIGVFNRHCSVHSLDGTHNVHAHLLLWLLLKSGLSL